MAVIRMKEIRKLSPEARSARLIKYREELSEKYSQLSAGGSIDNTGKISQLKRTIARFLTILNEPDESEKKNK